MLRTCIEKEKKNIYIYINIFLVTTGFEPRTPAWESNVTTTAPEQYVFKNESSFYIITYSS